MIEERAWVIEAGDRYAWVETQPRTACGACPAGQGCGILAGAFRQRCTRLRVLTEFPVRAGDEVIIGIAENALLKGSLAVYGVPLAGLLLGAVLGQLAVGGGEVGAVLLGSGGLAGGFAWLCSFTRKIRTDSRFQPVVLRLAAA